MPWRQLPISRQGLSVSRNHADIFLITDEGSKHEIKTDFDLWLASIGNTEQLIGCIRIAKAGALQSTVDIRARETRRIPG